MPIKKTVDQWLNDIDYTDDPTYVPSEFALEFISFIKLVNGDKGEGPALYPRRSCRF